MALVKKDGETMLDNRREITDYIFEQCGYDVADAINNLYEANDD